MSQLFVCFLLFVFFLGGGEEGEGASKISIDLGLVDVVNYEQMLIPTEEMLI